MGIINYGADKWLLLLARGHPYQHDSVCAAIETLREYDCSRVEQPAAQSLMGPQLAETYSACLCYDMTVERWHASTTLRNLLSRGHWL